MFGAAVVRLREISGLFGAGGFSGMGVLVSGVLTLTVGPGGPFFVSYDQHAKGQEALFFVSYRG